MRVKVVRSTEGDVGRLVFGVLSSLACLAAGVWALVAGGGSWISAVGLYFVGKAFFVGPQLVYGNH